MKNNNTDLKIEVKDLRQTVERHERLLSDFCVINAQHVVETEELRANVKYTQEELHETQQDLAKLQNQTNRICKYLGIQSVDEVMLSSGPIQLPLMAEESQTDIQ